ncbi:DUF1289 domain-containing protein [Pseudomonas sp. NPDC078700]|uniref:DUF1289 domain-containing protein n=1 Tax=Pseudomonas sp. NPDC078700 TaxID=3364424 RepID=UPI0037CC3285
MSCLARCWCVLLKSSLAQTSSSMSSEIRSPTPVRVESPCQRRCCLDADDTCVGCGRNLDEILSWNEADASQRLAICQRASQRLIARNN